MIRIGGPRPPNEDRRVPPVKKIPPTPDAGRRPLPKPHEKPPKKDGGVDETV